ncbi:hypothetical protein [Nonomuraea sp. NPDC049709]|uniref:hypothetical protein n=1 Tax=Nonomuraea sp. NPDC049709 TaxID=3154736 RepID=UPI003444F948
MITVIVFGIAAVTALEITLMVALLAMATTELAAILRQHGVRGGLRQTAAAAREICLAAKIATYSAVADRWAAR